MSKEYKKLITEGPDVYMRKLFETGWLDEWCDEETEYLYNILKETHKKEPKFMVFSLGEYTLEPEGIDNPAAYRDAIIKMLKTFDVKFTDDYISADTVDGKIMISVKTPKAAAHWQFKQTDDWLNDDFIDFINDEVLPALGEKRIFHPLPPASAFIELVFHYPETIDAAIDTGIIPDDDFFLK